MWKKTKKQQVEDKAVSNKFRDKVGEKAHTKWATQWETKMVKAGGNGKQSKKRAFQFCTLTADELYDQVGCWLHWHGETRSPVYIKS